MAIAPITGTLKRKIITDITIGFAAGFSLATLYWYTEHTPLVAKREAYYAQLQKQKEAENIAWETGELEHMYWIRGGSFFI